MASCFRGACPDQSGIYCADFLPTRVIERTESGTMAAEMNAVIGQNLHNSYRNSFYGSGTISQMGGAMATELSTYLHTR